MAMPRWEPNRHDRKFVEHSPEVRRILSAMAKKARETTPELQQALDAVGGVPVLAALLQMSALKVARWRTIPAEYAVEIEAKTGLPRERERPDRTITRRGR